MGKVSQGCLAALAGLGIAIGSTVMAGSPKTTDKKTDTKKAAAADSKTDVKPVRHQLPPHYAKIVDEKQREKIYAIQDSYAPDIKKIQEQLDAIKAKREAEIRGLLTAAQVKQLEAAIAASKKTDDEAMDASKSETTEKSTDKTDKKAKPKAVSPEPVKPTK
ncbi:MAG TPA: hypothetical protein VFE24_13935 [Pirellulales bacterium]|jgi:hypothetical protein|nr:hypothetical protein [Pirellulales bacterium]